VPIAGLLFWAWPSLESQLRGGHLERPRFLQRAEGSPTPKCIGGEILHSAEERFAQDDQGLYPKSVSYSAVDAGLVTISTMFSPQLLDHFQHPRNAGEVASADASAQIENPVCGDVLRLSLKIDSGRISEIRFQAKGCVPSMACASALTELVAGATLDEARALDRERVITAVGGLPTASIHAAQLALDALAAALRQLER